MKPTTKYAIAGLLSAAGSALQAFAAELTGATPQETGWRDEKGPCSAPETPAEQPAPAKRGRKPAAASAPADPQPETTAPAAEPEASADPATSEPKKEEGGESAEDNEARYTKNRALIEPLVKSGNGPAVKSTIQKYSANGLRELQLKDQSSFEKDIEALSM